MYRFFGNVEYNWLIELVIYLNELWIRFLEVRIKYRGEILFYVVRCLDKVVLWWVSWFSIVIKGLGIVFLV